MSQPADSQPEPAAEVPIASERQGIRWGLVILFTVLGFVVLTVAGIITHPAFGSEFWSGVLVNVGATILLAAVLVWFERRLTTSTNTAVREAVVGAADEATRAATAVVEQATRDLSARMDALRDQVKSRREEVVAAQDATVDALAEDVTWENVVDALQTARGLGAIEGRIVVVGASQHDDGPRLSFEYRPELTPFNPWDEVVPEAILIAWVVNWPQVEFEWTADMTAADAFVGFSNAMIAAGSATSEKQIDYGLMMSRLQTGLAEAMDGRRALDGAWRSTGALWEAFDDDWVFTNTGVEERAHGVVLTSPWDIPSPSAFKDWSPTKPEWTSTEDWERITKRAEFWVESWYQSKEVAGL